MTLAHITETYILNPGHTISKKKSYYTSIAGLVISVNV